MASVLSVHPLATTTISVRATSLKLCEITASSNRPMLASSLWAMIPIEQLMGIAAASSAIRQTALQQFSRINSPGSISLQPDSGTLDLLEGVSCIRRPRHNFRLPNRCRTASLQDTQLVLLQPGLGDVRSFSLFRTSDRHCCQGPLKGNRAIGLP